MPNKYVLAAQLIDSGKEEYSCQALKRVGKSSNQFIELYGLSYYSFKEILRRDYDDRDETVDFKQMRVLALLFAKEFFTSYR